MRRGIVVLLCALSLAACSPTTKPLSWQAADVDFSTFKAFDILPVVNATGHFVSPEILTSLTAHLKEKFAAQSLPLRNPGQALEKVLTVQSEILEYKVRYYNAPPPPYAKITPLCIVRTRLLQQSTRDVVAEIITVNKITIGRGLLEPKGPEDVLPESAAAIAGEVSKVW